MHRIKHRSIKASKYLLAFVVLICLARISPKAFSEPDTSRKERPQPPPHPKPPSLKEVINKINIFKKHKNDPPSEPVKHDDPPIAPSPAPAPPPEPVKLKTAPKHITVRKKTKKATPSTGKKKTKKDKPQSLI